MSWPPNQKHKIFVVRIIKYLISNLIRAGRNDASLQFVETCGKSKIADESPSWETTVGTPVTPHSYPWQAIIEREKKGVWTSSCGGSLISWLKSSPICHLC